MKNSTKLLIGVVILAIMFAFTISYAVHLKHQVAMMDEKIYSLEEQVTSDTVMYDILQADIMMLRLELNHTNEVLDRRMNLLTVPQLKIIGKNLYMAEQAVSEMFELHHTTLNEELLRGPKS